MSVFKRTYKKRAPGKGDWLRDPATGKPIRFETECFYGYLNDADGVFKRVKLYPDREASEARLADLKKQAYRGQSGLTDKYEDHRRRAIADHLEDFRRNLQADDNTEKHIDL